MECMLVSTLQKVFPDQKPEAWQSPALTMLSNQRAAFQLCWYCPQDQELQVSLQGLPGWSA